MTQDKMQIRVREQIRNFIPAKERSMFESLVDQFDSLEQKMHKASVKKAHAAAYAFAKCAMELMKEERRLLNVALFGVAKARDQIVFQRRDGAKPREVLKKRYKDREITRPQFFEALKALPPVPKLDIRTENGKRPILVELAQLKISIRAISGRSTAMMPAPQELTIRRMPSGAGISQTSGHPVKKSLLDKFDEVDDACLAYAAAHEKRVAG